MKDEVLDINDVLRKLRKQDNDDGNYEAKKCERDLSQDVWPTVSAFANTDGGALLLGIDEEEGFSFVEDFQIDKVLNQFVVGMGDGGQPSRLTNILSEWYAKRV